MATDLDRRIDGSPELDVEVEEKREKEEEEDDVEDDVAAATARGEHSQGRTWAQLGQRVLRRSRRQLGQIPVRRRFEG